MTVPGADLPLCFCRADLRLFLGAPRTTRQIRNFSIGSSILLRVSGCAWRASPAPVMAVKSRGRRDPILIGARIGGGTGSSSRRPCGAAAALWTASNKSNARLLRLVGRPSPHEHGHKHLWSLFAGRFVISRSRLFQQFVLLVLADYIEMSEDPGLAAPRPSWWRKPRCFALPQLLYRIMPFCVLIGLHDLLISRCRGGWNWWGAPPPASRPGSSSRLRSQARFCSDTCHRRL